MDGGRPSRGNGPGADGLARARHTCTSVAALMGLGVAEVNARVAGFDLQRDADGRHRINEVYCHDSTWQQALDAHEAEVDQVWVQRQQSLQDGVGAGHGDEILEQQHDARLLELSSFWRNAESYALVVALPNR